MDLQRKAKWHAKATTDAAVVPKSAIRCVVSSGLWSAWRVLITEQNGFYVLLFTLLIFGVHWSVHKITADTNITTYYILYNCPAIDKRQSSRLLLLLLLYVVCTDRRVHLLQRVKNLLVNIRSAVHRLIVAWPAIIKRTYTEFIQVWDFQMEEMYIQSLMWWRKYTARSDTTGIPSIKLQ